MMSAFITFNSNLVPLIEGLCRSNPWEFDFSGFRQNRTDDLGMNSSLLWRTEPHLHGRPKTCSLRFGPSGFFGPSRCLIPTPGLTIEYLICAVCVCVFVYTPTATYTPTRLKNRKDTDNSPISSSVIHNSPHQATSVLTDQLNPLTLCSQRWMNTLHIHERICTPCDERVRKCVRWCSQHLFNVYTCKCMVLTTLVAMHAYSPQKMHMHSCMRAYATVQKLLYHRNNYKLILNLGLAWASCRLSFAARPPAASTKSVAWWWLLLLLLLEKY